MKTIMIDGAPVEFATELAATMVSNYIGKLCDGFEAAVEEKKKADKDKEACDAAAKSALDAKDGEIAVLKKAVADAAITPEKLDVLVNARAAVCDAALAVLPADFAFTGKSLEDIRRATVDAKLGDAAKDMSDAAIEGAFKAITVDAAPVSGVQKLGAAFSAPGFVQRATVKDARDVALSARDKATSEAWKN